MQHNRVMENIVTLRQKFAKDGTTLAEVQGALAVECLSETVAEVGRDGKYVLSQLECGDYILDVLGSGDTILVLQNEIDEPSHADIRHLIYADAA
jgi:hypothetical protein